MEEIKVSIVCNTYNQENYISDALESFLSQKTNFKFEVLVHDDASTDSTPEIIRKYAQKHPEIIKPYYQTENQYSQKKKITINYQIPRAKGKYIALCEGDDFWTDENKLQKQYDYMERHPECFLCGHAANSVDSETKNVLRKRTWEKVGENTICDAIEGFGRIVATNTFFCKKELYEDLPEYYLIAPCGDYVLPIRCAQKGTIAYLDDNMAAYRVCAKNSFSERSIKDPEYLKKYYERYDKMLEAIDENTGFLYSKELKQEHLRIWFAYYMNMGDKKKLREEEFKTYLNNHSFKQRLKYKIQINFPKATRAIIKIKNNLKTK